MISGNLLVVDDQKTQRETLQKVLESWGHSVLSACNGSDALEKIKDNSINLVLTDLQMPKMGGLDLLSIIKGARPDIDVIVMTAYGSVDTAVQAMKSGATDFITKPVDLDQLEIVLCRTMDKKRLIRENKSLRQKLESNAKQVRLIGDSNAMHDVLARAFRVAETDATILIHGESGTGKELLSHTIHDLSTRANEPFVVVNCAALPESLIESELFGHVKGAFTGAECSRSGRIKQAEGGTLFLDEIGDISPMVQIKLLRFLQDQQYTPVGTDKIIQANVRVVTATHRNLQNRINEGKFRQDLFFRLNVVNLELPPLFARREDIPLLASHFLTKYSKRYQRPARTLSTEAMSTLMGYRYPGNVRELENIIEQAVVMTIGEVIQKDDLPIQINSSASEVQPDGISAVHANGNLPSLLDDLEKKIIIETLSQFSGNQSRTAKKLGLTESGLRYKLTKWKSK
jgi:DNA-binding NtrC family response regulator